MIVIFNINFCVLIFLYFIEILLILSDFVLIMIWVDENCELELWKWGYFVLCLEFGVMRKWCILLFLRSLMRLGFMGEMEGCDGGDVGDCGWIYVIEGCVKFGVEWGRGVRKIGVIYLSFKF